MSGGVPESPWLCQRHEATRRRPDETVVAAAAQERSEEGRYRSPVGSCVRRVKGSRMIDQLYSDFLIEPRQYSLSESYWGDLWRKISDQDRSRYGWQQPWFQPLPPKLGQGNPIFSAVSPLLRRGIRVIQHEPTSGSVEIQAWTDSFRGPVTDPESIKELVIACALSDLSAGIAMEMMRPWVANRPLSFFTPLAGAVPLPGGLGASQRRPEDVMIPHYDAA
jgi:hypothetical protein